MATDAPPDSPCCPLAPRVVGYAGLAVSALGAIRCLMLVARGLRQAAPEASLGSGHGSGVWLLAGLLFLPVSGLGIWLFIDFLRLPDWTVAPELPLGLKLLGHLGRVLGSIAAATCLALVVLAVVFPGHVPPAPMKQVTDAWVRIQPDAPDFHASRPLLDALLVLGVFAALAVRMLGSAVAEMRRWARLGTLTALGIAVALLTVMLVLNLTRLRLPMATMPLAVADGAAGALFIALLAYFALPRVVDAFEEHGL